MSRRDRRRAEAWAALLVALKAHPEQPMWIIKRCSGLSWYRTYISLYELETVNLVTARWEDPDGPYPRRRLYRVADPIE